MHNVALTPLNTYFNLFFYIGENPAAAFRCAREVDYCFCVSVEN